jgi:hypothetical protein
MGERFWCHGVSWLVDHMIACVGNWNNVADEYAGFVGLIAVSMKMTAFQVVALCTSLHSAAAQKTVIILTDK